MAYGNGAGPKVVLSQRWQERQNQLSLAALHVLVHATVDYLWQLNAYNRGGVC